MKTKLLPVLFLLWLCTNAQLVAQTFKGDVAMEVKGYDLNKVGFPSRMVAGELPRSLVLAEYMVRGGNIRENGHVLEGFDDKLQLQWYKPIVKPGSPPLKFRELYRMQTSLAVTAWQTDDKGTENTMVQFYDLKGREVGPIQNLSGYTKKMPADMREEVLLSPDGDKMLWLNWEPSDAARRRTYQASLWTTGGHREKLFKFTTPQAGDKLDVHQLFMDGKGNLYLLLTCANPSYTLADTAAQPKLLKLDTRSLAMQELDIRLPAQTALAAQIQYDAKAHQFYFYGILSNNLPADKNAKPTGMAVTREAKPTYWHQLAYARINLAGSPMRLDTLRAIDLPDSLAKRYAARKTPAQFAQCRTFEAGAQRLWVWEEVYTASTARGPQSVRGDLLVFCFQNDSLQWSSAIDKNQRDYGPDVFFGYVDVVATETFFHLIYLTEKGANGQVASLNINRQTGEFVVKPLQDNHNSDYYFIPAKSLVRSDGVIYLLGPGDLTKQEYRITKISYP